MVLTRKEIAPVMERMNDHVMEQRVSRTWYNQPKIHIGLNALYIEMRQELAGVSWAYKDIKHNRLKEQLLKNLMKEDEELREVGLAYTNTQP